MNLNVLEEIKSRIEKKSGDHLVVFHPSRFAEFETEFREVANAFGGLSDLEKFYRLCDGFSDARYTRLCSIEDFVSRASEAIAKKDSLKVVWFGDGNGLDEKHIELLSGDWFADGQIRFCFQDYFMGAGDDCETLRESVRTEAAEAFEEHYPDVEPNAYGLVDYGPCTFDQLLEYILETSKMV